MARKSRIHVGCSGWSYKDWKGVFYPKGTKPADYLAHYAKHSQAVEVDGSYYRAPSPADSKLGHIMDQRSRQD